MHISEIDKNLRVEETVRMDDIVWRPADSAEFRIYGCCSVTPFRRLPKETADNTNDGVSLLATNTAGIRLRLRTDSPYVAIHAEWGAQCCFSHMAGTGVSGFDMYRLRGGKHEFVGTFVPPFNCPHGYENMLRTPGGMQDLIIDFPLYNDVDKLFIGVSDKALFETPAGYGRRVPVVYYGSSITQGGCASRPGNSYQAMLSRALDCDYINLGFSGSAKGEQIMARYIAGLEMSAFVFDYDHNAPDAEHLARTHEPFFLTVREAHPDTPVIIISKPDVINVDPEAERSFAVRRDIIRKTYENALSRGDKNVYFIDGASIFGDDPLRSCTVDTCHPTDLGFFRFFERLYPLLAKLI